MADWTAWPWWETERERERRKKSLDFVAPARSSDPIQGRGPPFLGISPLFPEIQLFEFGGKFEFERGISIMAPSIGVNLRVTGHCNQGGRKYMEDVFSVAYQQGSDCLWGSPGHLRVPWDFWEFSGTPIMVYNGHLITATFESIDFLSTVLRPCLDFWKSLTAT